MHRNDFLCQTAITKINYRHIIAELDRVFNKFLVAQPYLNNESWDFSTENKDWVNESKSTSSLEHMEQSLSALGGGRGS